MSLRQKNFDSYHVSFQSGAGVDVCVNCVVGSYPKRNPDRWKHIDSRAT